MVVLLVLFVVVLVAVVGLVVNVDGVVGLVIGPFSPPILTVHSFVNSFTYLLPIYLLKLIFFAAAAG